MQVSVTFARREVQCDGCPGKIMPGHLQVTVSMMVVTNRFHYQCFRREACNQYLETEGESPEEDWVVMTTVGGEALVLYRTQEDDERYFHPKSGTYWRYSGEEDRWKQTVVV